MTHFWDAFFIGFVTAAIPGPVFLFFVSRTLKTGAATGIAVALGAAAIDFIYSSISALGLSQVSSFLIGYKSYARAIGCIFFLYFAYYEWNFDVKTGELTVKERKVIKIFFKIFLLNLTNPITIVSFIGMFFGRGYEINNTLDALLMGLGVFFGSILWFLILGSVVLKIRRKIPRVWINRIKYFSAAGIATLGFLTAFCN